MEIELSVDAMGLAGQIDQRVLFSADGAFRYFFFSQAEDGIRDLYVTGVQTCALPISRLNSSQAEDGIRDLYVTGVQTWDRKSTRLNSSHVEISYAVFCLTGVQTCALPIDRKSTRLNSSHVEISYAVFCF